MLQVAGDVRVDIPHAARTEHTHTRTHTSRTHTSRTHTHSHTLTHSHTHTLTHSHTHRHTHTAHSTQHTAHSTQHTAHTHSHTLFPHTHYFRTHPLHNLSLLSFIYTTTSHSLTHSLTLNFNKSMSSVASTETPVLPLHVNNHIPQNSNFYSHTKFEHYLSISIAANGIFQLLLDIVMEVLHIVPTRINHLSLTILNAFLAWKTLSAIQVSVYSLT
jgi:hypothetical protein